MKWHPSITIGAAIFAMHVAFLIALQFLLH
jgi:hypothetical protein